MRQMHIGNNQGGLALATDTLEGNQWSMTFTTSDILRIAECAENRVADFYNATAERFTSSPLRELCLELAELNRRHARYWSRTQAGLVLTDPQAAAEGCSDQTFQPESMVGLTWLAENRRPQDMLTGHEDAIQILRDAHRRIRDLATFYAGLKGFASNQVVITMIDRIVRMAKSQCTDIEQRLRLLTDKGTSSPATSPTRRPVILN